MRDFRHCVRFRGTARWFSYPHTYCCCLVTKSCPTRCDPMDCHLQDSSVLGISQARILEWVAFPSPGDLPDPGTEPALAGRCFTAEPSRMPPYAIYISSFFLRFFSHICITDCWVEFPVVCSRSSLVFYFVYSSVCVLNLSLPPCFPFGNHMFIFNVCNSASFFVNKLICIFFRFHMWVITYYICHFLSHLLHLV